MAIVLTPNLFVDSEPSPDYWVDVALPSGSGYSITGHNDVPEAPNEEDELHIEVRVAEGSSGNQSITVDIGMVEIDPEDGLIVIHLMKDIETEVGGGNVLTQNATETTRPIPNL